MTDFERLLLAKGDAQLISAFVKDYYEIISEDFKVSFDKYLAEVREQSDAKVKTSLSDLEKVRQDIKLMDMSISELLEYHDGDTKLKTRMLNALSNDFSTVGELLAPNKSNVYVSQKIGAKSISILVECLGEIGYKNKINQLTSNSKKSRYN